ncbi:MAG TPA: malto-oligosyltrehalose synthase [Solirubrobacteraceae bacterium]
MSGPAGTGLELRATYRLQLTSAFGFESARLLLPYLRDLGISHLYLSPSLQARHDSSHGYDVIDPTRLSDELGGADGFRALADEARGAGMGIVLDIVPNHMAVDPENRFWADETLRRRYFDIDPATGRWRRFADIDEMAGVRQEDGEVFDETHRLILELVDAGLVDGLRIDHVDGLADPAGYLDRLRARGARRVWVEKILAADERLPDWPVSGTVGYEFSNEVLGLFVDPAGEAELTSVWEWVSGDKRPFGAWALEAKLDQALTTFRPELERLARVAGAPVSRDQGPESASTSDASVERLALAAASLPVYRTYVAPQAGEFITRFQQTTPAIMAKGVEDTAFYRYGRLLALNDVGGDPERFGIGVQRFHAAAAERAVRFPEGLLTTMTHDAKRSGDVRARLASLAGMAVEWRLTVERWMGLSERFLDGGAPDEIERYYIFQTLVGCWPIELERLQTHLRKALREAKRNTSWVAEDEDWEQAVMRFVAALTSDPDFIAALEPFAGTVARAGERIALAQLVLKLTSPGVPDFYQGDELELLAMVDPDNRRPVDWGLRQTRLAHLIGGGRPGESDRKLWMTSRLLGLRARRAAPFTGDYEPLDAGEDACAFVRGGDVLTVVTLPRGGAEREPVLVDPPAGRWRDLLTGDERSFARDEPVAKLVSEHGIAVYERV